MDKLYEESKEADLSKLLEWIRKVFRSRPEDLDMDELIKKRGFERIDEVRQRTQEFAVLSADFDWNKIAEVFCRHPAPDKYCFKCGDETCGHDVIRHYCTICEPCTHKERICVDVCCVDYDQLLIHREFS